MTPLDEFLHFYYLIRTPVLKKIKIIPAPYNKEHESIFLKLKPAGSSKAEGCSKEERQQLNEDSKAITKVVKNSYGTNKVAGADGGFR